MSDLEKRPRQAHLPQHDDEVGRKTQTSFKRTSKSFFLIDQPNILAIRGVDVDVSMVTQKTHVGYHSRFNIQIIGGEGGGSMWHCD